MMDRPSFWRADGDRKDLDCDGCGRMWDEHSADGSYCPIEPESEIEALRAENAALAKLVDELDGSFDQQTYQERSRDELDAPDDREYSVNVTAKQLRAISAAALRAGQQKE